MIRLSLTLFLALALCAADRDLAWLQAPGGGSIQTQVAQSDRVKVSSPYWRLEFDLRNGGVLDTIVFHQGSGRNLLVDELLSWVDHFADGNSPSVEFHSSKEGDVTRLEFSGRMAAAGRQPGPVTFRTLWTISPFVVRADHIIRVEQDLMASSVGIGSGSIRADLDEFGARSGPAIDPDRRKQAPATFGKIKGAGDRFIDERHAPLYWLFFRRNQEGFDLTAASDLETWESGLAGRTGLGRYEAAVSADGSRIEIHREPLSTTRPARIRKGEYTFSYYLGLPRIVEKSDRRWRHLSFGNHPWPSDAEVARWAENGVNIARLHNDYATDENFWHDGAWPPYDEKGMAEMRRVIAACHRHNIKVVPYFSIHEFHPKAQGYQENEKQWARTNDQLGSVYHNLWGKGEFGAQMCPQSGWLERRKQDIEKAYRELGFDGIYYDWVMELACNNKNHDPKLHLGTDGVIDLLAWTRRLVSPSGTLILHLYGKMPSIAFENFADLVVNMEEISGAEQIMRMGEVPVVTVLAESIPRSPCPSYREDRARERNQNNIAQLVVLGMFPWSGGTGGEVYEETLKLFRAFKPYKLEEHRFRDAYSGAVETAWPDVYGAVYGSRGLALAVVSNTSSTARKNVVWRVDPKALGFSSQPARIGVKDTSTGKSETLPFQALTDGSLVTGLGGYEYRIFELRPVP